MKVLYLDPLRGWANNECVADGAFGLRIFNWVTPAWDEMNVALVDSDLGFSTWTVLDYYLLVVANAFCAARMLIQGFSLLPSPDFGPYRYISDLHRCERGSHRSHAGSGVGVGIGSAQTPQHDPPPKQRAMAQAATSFPTSRKLPSR